MSEGPATYGTKADNPSSGLRDRRKQHDARITYDVIDGYLAKMSGSACKVYLALCRHANWTTDETFVKIGTIAKLCGLSPGTVSKTLAELVGLALISRAERYRPDKSRTSDLITLLDPPPLEKDADPPHESDTHPGYEIGGDTNKHYLNDPILSPLSEERKPDSPIGEAAPKRRAAPKDPLWSHPAIKAVQAVKDNHQLPPRGARDRIIKILGEHPDIEKLRACWTEWSMQGYKPTSWKWLEEWYPKGIPARKPSTGSGYKGGNGLDERMAILQRRASEEVTHG